MEIRGTTEADLSELRRLWDAMNSEATFTPYPPPAFDGSLINDYTAVVAVEQGQPIGTVYANLASPHFAFVFGLYVVPGSRRKGVARALMRAPHSPGSIGDATSS